jgi:hypothetical protein
LVLVHAEDGSAQLARVQVKQTRLIATARMPADRATGAGGDAVAEALDALSQGRSIGDAIAWNVQDRDGAVVARSRSVTTKSADSMSAPVAEPGQVCLPLGLSRRRYFDSL